MIRLDIVQGSTTVELQGRGITPLDYVPVAPTEQSTVETPTISDGGLVGSILYKDVPETFSILLKGKTREDIQTKFDTLGRIFRGIRDTPTYAVYHSGFPGSRVWRSPLNRAVFKHEDSIKVTQKGAYCVVTIAWERKYYWEDNTLQTLRLSNSYGSRTTSPIPVRNGKTQLAGSAGITFRIEAGTGRLKYAAGGLEIFTSGMPIEIQGSTDGNDGFYTVDFPGATVSQMLTTFFADEAAHAGLVVTSACPQNYVDVLGSDIEGAIPAPVRFEYFNTYNSVFRTYDIMVGQNVFGSPLTSPFLLEAENAVVGGTVGPAVGNTDVFSGGFYSSVTLGVDHLLFDLTAAQVSMMKGQYYRILVHLTTAAPAETWMKVQTRAYTGLTVLEETGFVLLATTGWPVYDLGVVQIPPGLKGYDNLVGYSIDIITKDGTGSVVREVLVDYVLLMPVTGWRKLTPLGFYLAYTGNSIDDNIEGSVYYSGSGDALVDADRLSISVASGPPLMVYPKVTQRYYVFVTGAYDVRRTGTVRIQYRPRVTVL